MVAQMLKIWYNHEMRRRLRLLAYGLLLVLAILLYREWVERNRLPLFLPLGFSTAINAPIILEEAALNPTNWLDPQQSAVVDAEDFDSQTSNVSAPSRATDILVIGATLGGLSAALSAAEDGATVLVATPNDWKEEIRTYAGTFVTATPPAFAESEIERLLQRALSGSIRTPSIVSSTIERLVQTQPQLEILSSYSLTLLSRNDEGHIDRALLQRNDGTHAIVVRLKILIDGTREGSTLAKAGVKTTSGWDAREDTEDPASLPATSIQALSEGFTLSGATVPGIGKRLGGLTMQMGIIDRGFGGQFIAPHHAEDCWILDSDVTSFALATPVLRATKTDCAATATLSTSYQDSVELFYINHGNDTVSLAVDLGTNAALNIVTHMNPAEKIVRIGAFSVGPHSPLTITVRSALPAEHLEGFVVRKLNTNSDATVRTTEDQRAAAFITSTWAATTHDIYLRTTTESDTLNVHIDDQSQSAHRIGEDTFILRDIVLTPGEHSLHIADGHGPSHSTIIPIAPHSKTNPLIDNHDDTVTAILHASDAYSAHILPPANGMYDVWIRSNRSRSAMLIMNDKTEEWPVADTWTFAGTRWLTRHGLRAEAKGSIDIVAIPNTVRDVYVVPVSPKETVTLTDLPYGRYRVVSDGPDNPRSIRLYHDTQSIQELTFDPSDGPYEAHDNVAHHHPSLKIEGTQPWPQNVVFYEYTDTANPLPLSTLSGALMRVSRNEYIFEPFKNGIGPVTIGTLESSTLQHHIRSMHEDAYVFLRYGTLRNEVTQQCSSLSDITCDTRRYERHPTMFGTADALGRSALTTDGRRLIGKDILRSINTDTHATAIVTVVGVASTPTILSPSEQTQHALTQLIRSLDENVGGESQPITLTLGMFLPREDTKNILAITTLSATHAAAQSLQSPSIELAIGSAIGHVAAFALLKEHIPLELLRQSPDAMKRLQYFLVEKGLSVIAYPNITDDQLLLKAIQRRMMNGQWPPTSLEGATTFGKNTIRTVGDALRLLPGAPSGSTSQELVNFGISNGFVSEKMLRLDPSELLQLPLTEEFLLKAEYLLTHTH